MIGRRLELRAPIDLSRSLAELRHGLGDRTIRLGRHQAWLCARTSAGAAALHVRLVGPAAVEARTWGDGAEAMLEAVPALLGERDDPERLVARHAVVRELQRRLSGFRMPRTGRLLDALVPAVLEQKVTGTEAHRAYVALVRRYGEPAPGETDLLLPPSAATLARLPYHAFHPLGVERRRADVIRRAAARAGWLDAAGDAREAHRRLVSLPGIGAWTAAEVVRVAFGDPDAVSIGDYHLPNTVAWALAGEPRADDARMLELLEPYRGQRARVQRLLELGGLVAPRYGPRLAPRRIADL